MTELYNLIQNDTFQKLVILVMYAVCFVFSFSRTHNLKTTLKEMSDMTKYRTEHYKDSKDYQGDFALAFDNLVKQYHLNEIKNELVELKDKIDRQAIIDSARDTALDRTLNRLLPQEPDTLESGVVDLTGIQDDLDFLTQGIEIAETYREKFNLGDEMSTQQIFDFVQSKASELATRNANVIANAKAQAQKNIEKEIENNETEKTEQKSE